MNLSSLLTAAAPYKLYLYAIAAVALLGIGSAGGYKVGKAFQAADDNKLTAAAVTTLSDQLVAANAQATAIAKAAADDKAAAEQRDREAQTLLKGLTDENAALAVRLDAARRNVRVIHEKSPAAAAWLDSALPADLVRGVLDADQAGPAAVAGHP